MSADLKVFITCPQCGHHNLVDGTRATRVDLAILRGIEDPIPCKECGTAMETVDAYCGEQVGPEMVRRQDPKS